VADLLDINVWVAISNPKHSSFNVAVKYWRTQADENLVFCRVTALGFVRVSSQSRAFADGAFSPQEAWTKYTAWIKSKGVTLQADPENLDIYLGQWLASGIVTNRIFMDAYLAAFAVAAGHRLVSFDNDFHRFEGLNFLHLE